jgi:hypothetical protein
MLPEPMPDFPEVVINLVDALREYISALEDFAKDAESRDEDGEYDPKGGEKAAALREGAAPYRVLLSELQNDWELMPDLVKYAKK